MQQRAVDKFKYYEKIGYTPHPAQIKFHTSQARFRLPMCGRRFGKSTMAARDREPSLLVPNTRGWIVAPTYDLGEKEFRIIWDDMMDKLKLRNIPGLKKAYNLRTGELFIQFPWNSSVTVKSAQKPDQLVGESLDWVIMAEAAKLPATVWEKYIRPSLADKRGGADFPTTPEGFNWVYNLCLKAKTESAYETWNFASWENPFVYPLGFEDPEIQLMMRTQPKPWFEQEIAAKFTTFVGQIFEEFDLKLHVHKWTYRPKWQDIAGIDFGFTNPFVFLDGQVGPSGQLAVWREYYRTRVPTWVHGQVLKRRKSPVGYSVRRHTWADPEDPDAIATLTKYLGGINALETPWQSSVMEIKRLLINRVGQWPMLIVDPSCVNLITEFNQYRTKPGREGLNAREDAEDANNHALSALRYMVWNEVAHPIAGEFAEMNAEVSEEMRGALYNIAEESALSIPEEDLESFARSLREGVF